MKGSFFLGNGQFELREMELGAPGPGQVLIRNMAAGICGTDVHIMRGEKGSADVTPPVVLGHEYSGIVEAIGEGVITCRSGDHVTVDPNMYCGKCRFCRNGQKQFCEHLVAVGVNFNGGFAEYSMVPEAQVFPLSPELDFEQAAMAEPTACCLHGIEQAGIRNGDAVLVVGGGAIGMIMVQLAKLRGASQVILSEPSALRREIGLTIGADAVIDPLAAPVGEQLKKMLNRDGVDVAIECAGNGAATQSAFDAVDRGGRILLFSVPGVGAKFSLDLFDVFKKELHISGSFINPDTHLEAVRLLNEGRLNLRPLITHRFGLDEVRQAIEKQTQNDSIKVMVLPNGTH
ncbi:MAG: zinc-dependent alcohol dehydrogenase family protein [Eubacteriales bacterium]|nr:zinc-dependent alcohol dehydrogenase family protein [Eubacteriales bacterium]